VAVIGDHVLCASRDGSHGVYLIDVSDPAAPVRLAVLPEVGRAWSGAYDADRRIAVFTAEDAGLSVVDLANPLAPVLVARLPMTLRGGVDLLGRYAVVADFVQGLLVVDLVDPAAPVVVASVELAARGRDVVVLGDHAYVGSSDDLYVIDLSAPHAPEVVATIPEAGYAQSITGEGHLVVVNSASRGLRLFDVATPDAPVLVGNVDTPGYAYATSITDGLLYVADGGAGLVVLPGHCDDGAAEPGVAGAQATTDVHGAPAVAVWPNPFRTEVHLDLSATMAAASSDHTGTLSIFDTAGRRVVRVVEFEGGGVRWNGHDLRGRVCPPGVYLYHFVQGTTEARGRLVKLH
jgi:hypothetical protein